MNAAANPTTIETRVPTRSWEKTSAPLSVVPSGCDQLGDSSTSVLDAYGS